MVLLFLRFYANIGVYTDIRIVNCLYAVECRERRDTRTVNRQLRHKNLVIEG